MAETLERDINIKVNTSGVESAEKKVQQLSKQLSELINKFKDAEKKRDEYINKRYDAQARYETSHDEKILKEKNEYLKKLDDYNKQLSKITEKEREIRESIGHSMGRKTTLEGMYNASHDESILKEKENYIKKLNEYNKQLSKIGEKERKIRESIENSSTRKTTLEGMYKTSHDESILSDINKRGGLQSQLEKYVSEKDKINKEIEKLQKDTPDAHRGKINTISKTLDELNESYYDVAENVGDIDLLKEIEDEIKIYQRQLDKEKDALLKSEEKVLDNNKIIEELKVKLYEHNKLIEETQSKINITNERYEASKDPAIAKAIEEEQQKLDAANKKLEDLRGKSEEYTKLKDDIQVKINDLDKKYEASKDPAIAKAIDVEQKKMIEAEKSLTKIKAEQEEINKLKEETEKKITETSEKYEASKDDSILAEIDRYSAKADEYQDNMNKIADSVRETGEALTSVEGDASDTLFGQLANVVGSGGSASSITSLMKTLGASAPEIAAVAAALAVIVKVLGELSQAVDEVTGAYKAAGKAAAGFVGDIALGNIEAVVDTIQLLSDGLHEVTDACAEAVNELQEFAELGKEVQDAYFSIYTYLGPKLGSNLIEYTNTMSMLYNLDNKKQLQNLRGILAATTQLGLKKDDLLKYTKAFQSFVNDLAVFSGDDISAVASQLENAINMNVLNSRSAVAKALDLNDSDIKKFKELNTQLERATFLLNKGSIVAGLHARYMETDAGKVEQLKNAWENFYNTVGKLALQLWARIAPILTQLLNFASMALNALAKIFNFDIKSPVANNSENIAGKYAEIGDAIEETGDKAKDASRKVASFDDVIQINENKSSKDKTDISELGLEGYDPSIWLEDFDEDVKDTIFDIDKLKAYIQELLDKFKAWEEGLDWDNIRKQARLFGETLADIANVIVDNEKAWVDLGDLVGNSVNTIAEALDGFATTFNWNQLGTDIRKMLREMFVSLDTELLGKTLYDVLAGIIEFAIGLFKNGGVFKPAAEAITRIFVEFLNNLSSDESISQIDKLISVFINDVLNAINKSLDILEANNVNEKISSIIKNIFTSLGENLPDIVATFSRLLVSEIDLLGDVISNAIAGLFEGLEIKPEAVDTIVNSLISIINTVFGNIGKIGEELYKHKDKIVEIIKKFIDGILEFAVNHSEDLVPLTETLIEIIKSIDIAKLHTAIISFIDNSGITELITEVTMKKMQIEFFAFFEKVHLFVSLLIKSIGDALGGLFTIIITTLIGLGVGISDIVGKIVNTIGEFVAAVFGSLETIGEDISKWISDKWSSITESFDKAINWFRDLFEYLGRDIKGVIDNIKKWFDDLKNSVLGVFSGIIDKFKEAKDALGNFIKEKADAIKNFGDNLFGGFSIGIPKMAIGGIVQQSTIANIGEDGAEAVLPLEKNTGWMDVLANKLSSRMATAKTTGNSGSITVNVGNKGFYTRSEMIDMAEQVVSALRVYGVNISVAY